jgi:hypothetical protein
MSQIQPADHSARRKYILMIAVATLVGAIAIIAFESYRPELEKWLLNEPERMREKLNWMLAVFSILSILLLLGAVHLWRMGQSVIQACRFPPPGVAVAVDTPVITGAKAISRGRLLKFSSLLLAACAVVVPVALWLVLQMLLGDA